jgi:hypothetical protein
MVDRRLFLAQSAAAFAGAVAGGGSGIAAAAPRFGVIYPRPIPRRLPGGPPPTIAPAPTSNTVLIGYSHPLKTPAAAFGQATPISSLSTFQTTFGGEARSTALAAEADRFGDLAVAVAGFFANGGTAAWVIALSSAALPRTGAVLSVGPLTFTALEITDAAHGLTVAVLPRPTSDTLADVVLTYAATTGATVETWRGVSLSRFEADGVTPDPNFIETRIGTAASPVSILATVQAAAAGGFVFTSQPQVFPAYEVGARGIFAASDFTAALAPGGVFDQIAAPNLLVAPGVTEPSVLQAAVAACERRKALLLLDPPLRDSADGRTPGFPHTIQATATGPDLPRSPNAALYFPYLVGPNPFTGAPVEIPPAALVAGLYAASDQARGVWKAPAGVKATLNGVTGVVARGQVTEPLQAALSPLGVNCLRAVSGTGVAVWGARTLSSAPQWTYVPVRRMALFMESSLQAGLQWTLFEPNGEPLWAAIRLAVGGFLQTLFLQGAFQGRTPQAAYFVKCDRQTMTQADIDAGKVNLVVGFAPLKPAEFVVIQIGLLTGQTSS